MNKLSSATILCRNVTDYVHDEHTRKAWCIQNKECPSTIQCEYQMRFEGSGDAFWDVCLDNLYDSFEHKNNSCLVYSFGISNDFAFDLNMARIGCEVHLFDPTVNYQQNFGQNCYFHPYGVYGGPRNTSYSLKFQSKYYGSIQDQNKMLRLDEIIEMLGHQNRTISILKIDCEGCELEVFGHRHPKTYESLAQINQILVEFHFSSSLGIDNAHRIPLIANSYDTIINNDRNNKFTKFYQNDRVGYSDDQTIIPALVELGFAESSCCREMGFIRQCNNVNSNGINITEYALEQYKKSLEGYVFGLHSQAGNSKTDKSIFLMQNGKKRLFPSGEIFASHGYDFYDTKMEREGNLFTLLLLLLLSILTILIVYNNWVESGQDMTLKA